MASTYPAKRDDGDGSGEQIGYFTAENQGKYSYDSYKLSSEIDDFSFLTGELQTKLNQVSDEIDAAATFLGAFEIDDVKDLSDAQSVLKDDLEKLYSSLDDLYDEFEDKISEMETEMNENYGWAIICKCSYR